MDSTTVNHKILGLKTFIIQNMFEKKFSVKM